jgi:hypothetical protein
MTQRAKRRLHSGNVSDEGEQRAPAVERRSVHKSSGLPSKRIEEDLLPKAPSVMQKMSESKLVKEGFDVLR